MKTDDCHACREYNALTRRHFLGASGGVALAAAAAPAWLPSVVYAQSASTDRDVIISLYLRGATDGLTACVPHTEEAYYANRPNLAIAPPDSQDPDRAIDLDGFFGFPPAMAPLVEAFQAGHLAIVHATGSTDPTRSHFDAQRYMEVGKPGDPTLFTGWLGRHLMTAAPMHEDPVLRAVGIGFGLQRTLAGGPLTVPVPNLSRFGLSGDPNSEQERREVLSEMYAAIGDPLRAAAENTQETIDLLDAIDFDNYEPGGGAVYPETAFGRSLKSSAALIKADVGVEAIAVDRGGWDTHNNQGVIEGRMADLMTDLAGGIAALHKDMFADDVKFTLVVNTEFGRRLLENGSGGTDHGHGGIMIAMGPNIAGGQVLTEWPGLDDLFQGRDLQVTIDYRDILAEIVQKRLGNQNLDVVFPDYTPTFRGITKA